ncbi:MAG: hypothetical protein RTV31_06940 [Candidatus Thorarchaeota archaeon]
MAAAPKSMIMFIIGAICFIIQAVISAEIFSDTVGAILASGFVIIMFIGSLFAWKGGMSALFREVYSYDTGPNTRVSVQEDTGQRVQCTPCFGICSGIASIIVIVMIGGELFGLPEFALLSPGILGAVFAFLAAIMFFTEYKGEYFKQVSV